MFTCHIDFDSFFASCEIRRNPDLEGKPVIVGNGERSVVSAASYEARAFGVYSAMPVFEAKRICPDGIYLPVDMEYYLDVSKRAFEVIGNFVTVVEKISVDEGYFDPTPAKRLFGSEINLALQICDAVKREIAINCSIGIATSKSIAKIASNYAKPAGIFFVPNGEEVAFLNKLPAKALWGIGRATVKKLEQYGVETIAELSALPENTVKTLLGQKNGTAIWQQIHAIDDRKVDPEFKNPKSIGRERTLRQNTRNFDDLSSILIQESRLVAKHLREQKLAAKTITLSIVTSDRIRTSIAKTIDVATDIGAKIHFEALEMLKQFFAQDERQIRLIGVYVSKLHSLSSVEASEQLFDQISQCDKKHRAAEIVMAAFENEFDRKNWK